MARPIPCSRRTSGVRMRLSPSRWLEMTGSPVWNADPVGLSLSAPVRACPTTPGFQPTPGPHNELSLVVEVYDADNVA